MRQQVTWHPPKVAAKLSVFARMQRVMYLYSMAYLKFQGEGLFNGREILPANQVLITNEKGIVEDIIADSEAGADVQHVNGILSPGFVNTHCHLELSHMKALLPEKTGLVAFVTGVMQHRNFSQETILEAIAAGEQEMWDNGIVAVGDICNTTHTVAQKSLHRLHYHNFIETSGFIPASANTRFEQAVQTYKAFPAVHSSITPHAPYSVSPALFELINEHSAGKVISVHNQETPDEDALFLDGISSFRQLYSMLGADISFYQPPGCTSIQCWLPKTDKPNQVLLVHNTCTTETDIRFAQQLAAGRQQTLYWTLCPNANLYIENRLPHVDLLVKHQCAITVGTDSLASNWQLSILAELQTLRTHFTEIPLEQLLQWATLNGAQALQLAHTLGSFEKGKQPGVLLLDKRLESVKRLL
ncbi:adenosine deaminase, alternative form [Filimonas lacunae]|nr:adenosine deaminase, alternative form [Filimonas lacunae]